MLSGAVAPATALKTQVSEISRLESGLGCWRVEEQSGGQHLPRLSCTHRQGSSHPAAADAPYEEKKENIGSPLQGQQRLQEP